MAMKIKDGLFIGDAETSQSEDFINDNKISNLINLAGRELPNLWSAHGLVYMTFNWEDRPDFKLGLNSYKHSSGSGDFITDMVEFIDISIMHGISVLIFSRNGIGRAAVAVCLYLMVKYRWGFEKAFEYLYSKKPDVKLNRGFVQQLYAFDKHLLFLAASSDHYHLFSSKQDSQDPSSFLNHIASIVLSKTDYSRWKDWNPAYLIAKDGRGIDDHSYDRDELLLVYSYINSKVSITTLPGPYRTLLDAPPKNSKIKFAEAKYTDDSRARAVQYPLRGILKFSMKSDSIKEPKERAFSRREDKDQPIQSYPSHRVDDSALPKAPYERNSPKAMRDKKDIDDLYGYVGMETTRGLHDSFSKTEHLKQLSAEDRLKKLVAGLIQPTGKEKSSSIPLVPERGSFSRHDAPEPYKKINYSGSNAVKREIINDNQSLGASSRGFDPLQAYESLQRSGAVKARHDTDTYQTPIDLYPKQKSKVAWTENPLKSTRSDDNISIDSGIYSTASNSDRQQAPKQYRRGSPAPRSQQRSSSVNSLSIRQPSPSKPVRQPSPSRLSGEQPRANQQPASQLRRKGSETSLASAETIESERDYYSRQNSRGPVVDLYKGMPSAPSRQSSRSSLSDSEPSKRYSSPQTKSRSNNFDERGTILAGRSSTPSRATWKY